MNTKIASYVGLAMRSGNALLGEDIICERLSLVKVVLIDADAPEKYRERLKRKLDGIPVYIVDNLAEATHRDAVKALAVTNVNLANAIINILR